MDLGLRGKVALVPASSKGLGRACALELAREGCAVAICGRDEAALRAAAQEIAGATGATVLPVAADLARAEDIVRFVASARAELGDPVILVTNAGGPPAASFEQLDDAAWEAGFNLTVLSVVRLIRAVLPGMRAARWGRIVNITAISAKQPIDGRAVSNTLRPGIVGLAKTLAVELAPDGITVNNVAPGYINTEEIRELVGRRMQPGMTAEEAVVPVYSRGLMGRLGEPEELAATVAFLASERASFITGATIAVDGGASRGLL
jgi:3-oxoacyl-[acyl-carrier protein] reductase